MFTDTETVALAAPYTSPFRPASEPPPASETRPIGVRFEPVTIRLTAAQEFVIHAIELGRQEHEIAASLVLNRGVPLGLARATAGRVLGALLRKGAIVRDESARSGFRLVPMRTPAERLTERNRQLDDLERAVISGRMTLRSALTSAAGIGARLGA